MLHRNPSQISLRGISRIIYPKQYPILHSIQRKKILAVRHSLKKECCVFPDISLNPEMTGCLSLKIVDSQMRSTNGDKIFKQTRSLL